MVLAPPFFKRGFATFWVNLKTLVFQLSLMSLCVTYSQATLSRSPPFPSWPEEAVALLVLDHQLGLCGISLTHPLALQLPSYLKQWS